jgi:ATP-binding protein involved in chromosome partitioning
MRIAVPVDGGTLATHFGHCEYFVLFDVADERKEIVGETIVEAPPHQPGLLPLWLARYGTNVVLAGGVGSRAVSIFGEQNIRVIVGAPAKAPREVVGEFLAGRLETRGNACGH